MRYSEDLLHPNEHIVRLCDDLNTWKGVLKAGTYIIMDLETGIAQCETVYFRAFEAPVSFAARLEGTC